MPHREFVVSLHIWLGIPLFSADLGSKRCSCGQILDKFGDHLLGCGQNNLGTRRHDAVCAMFFFTLCLWIMATAVRNNAATLILVPDRVIFFILTLNKLVRVTYFDVTVRNTVQPSYVTQTAYSAGNAAAAGEREKDQRHEANVTSTGSIFHPLV